MCQADIIMALEEPARSVTTAHSGLATLQDGPDSVHHSSLCLAYSPLVVHTFNVSLALASSDTNSITQYCLKTLPRWVLILSVLFLYLFSLVYTFYMTSVPLRGCHQ